ncbi:DUF1513 domain-containing protein [Rhodobacterales bacterium HKCCE3408]|nr:DUF1513 domain-containing protein [Rhodobacterales bacterium HKCCE3408]
MTTRRGFLAGILAASATPRLGWADAGGPSFLAAARAPDGSFRLCGLDDLGGLVFDLPLPDRGHAAAAHPDRPEAVAFARRPGTFAIVLNCATGRIAATLSSPPNRHFYGHGAFSEDGTRLFTTENNIETLDGVIGVWDTAGYERIDEYPSGGIGPHEIRRLPGSDTLVVANGGIATHPDSDRAKLNLPTMHANLTYLDPDGAMLERHELPEEMQLHSLRHLAIRADGLVAGALQWQGEAIDAPPLLALHRRGGELRFLSADPATERRMAGYAGSVSFSGDGRHVAITSPLGGCLTVFSAETGAPEETALADDVCGLAPSLDGFVTTTGTGRVARWPTAPLTSHDGLAFDNHLVALT